MTELDLMYYANFTIFSDVSTSVAALFLFSAMMKSYYLWLSSRCKGMDTTTQLEILFGCIRRQALNFVSELA